MAIPSTRPGPRRDAGPGERGGRPWDRGEGRPRRSREHRVVGGVAAGLGQWLGLDPILLRLAFVVLATAGGVGIVLYAVAWALLPEGDGPTRPAAPAAHEQALALACLTLGAVLLLRRIGLLFPEGLVWPVTLAAAGLGVVWARSDAEDRERWLGAARRHGGADVLGGVGRWLVVRLAVGVVLLLAGIVSLFATGTVDVLGRVAVAIVATAVGIGLLVGPWVVRLWRELGEERRERIRSEERADMAAHLHDSVLQTLALIQRMADSPSDTVRLARRQERDLRAWLYGDRDPASGAATLAAALDGLATEVEASHAVAVEVVTVGDDRPVDEPLAALLAAVREAVLNAARHSGAPEVSVYVEVDGSRVGAFVRDRGEGFDPAAVPDDRRGIADSIVGRMQRHGGRAEVLSEPGEGTEVAIELDLEARGPGR